MNYKQNEQNPIEFIRLTQRMSQLDFAERLGFPNKHQYTHHMKNFTKDIIDKVKVAYDRDVTMEIINHLKCKCRRLQKKLKQQQVQKKQHTAVNKKSDGSISSILDKV